MVDDRTHWLRAAVLWIAYKHIDEGVSLDQINAEIAEFTAQDIARVEEIMRGLRQRYIDDVSAEDHV